jgi:hypothetical protein
VTRLRKVDPDALIASRAGSGQTDPALLAAAVAVQAQRDRYLRSLEQIATRQGEAGHNPGEVARRALEGGDG